MIIERCIQGSEEWHKLRVANPGASGFSNIITSKGKISASREKYLYKMAGEKLSGEKEESFSSAAMARGTELEPKARQSFQFETGLQVEEVGLIYPNELRQYHASPDGLIIGQKKGLEIKAPIMSTHVGYLAKNKLPTEYVCQVQSSLLCTGYESWYFFSYYPGIKPLLIEVPRDEKLISLMDEAIREFIFDLGVLVEMLA